MELCAQYCVREAFYIFLSLGMLLLLCHLFSVFFFPSVDKSSTSLFFHLTELQIHPIRIGYVQSERGEQDFFSLLPADKKKKTQGKKKENRKRGSEWDIDPHSSPYNTRETIVGWVPWFSDSSSSRRNLNSFSLYAIDRNRYSSHSSFSSAPRRRRRRMKKRQKAWAVVEMAESSSISPSYYKEPGNLRGARKKNAFPPY